MSANFDRLLGSSLVLIATSGCNLIFGIQDGQLDAGSGGGSTGSLTTTSAGGGGTGAMGGGGQMPGATCTALPPFDLLSSLDLAATIESELIATATRPGDSRVHIALETGSNQIVARTVRVQGAPELSPIVVYPSPADTGNRRIGGAYVTDDEFRVVGIQDNVPGEFVFPANPDVGEPNAAFRPYPMPTECQQLRALSVHVGAADMVPRFAASCLTMSSQALLFGGRTDSPNAFVVGPRPLDGIDLPADMSVRVYMFIGGEHVILLDAEDLVDSEPALRRGNTSAALDIATPIMTPPNQALLFFGSPNAPNDQVFLSAIHVDPDTIGTSTPDGGYTTGLVGVNDLTNLAADPLGTLGHEVDFSTLEAIAPPFTFQNHGNLFVGGAATNFDITQNSTARLFLWGADGTPLAFGFKVFTGASPDDILSATAATAGFGDILSVWVELAGGVYYVRGARVQCMVAS